jgi:hypothetical protein
MILGIPLRRLSRNVANPGDLPDLMQPRDAMNIIGRDILPRLDPPIIPPQPVDSDERLLHDYTPTADAKNSPSSDATTCCVYAARI